jgi:hypothetical protein
VATDGSRYYKIALGTVSLDIGTYAATTSEAGTSYLLIKNIDGSHYKILLSELMNWITSQLAASANPLLTADYVYTNNPTLSGAVANQDGLTPAAGTTVLCIAQASAINNGLWVTAAGAWTRATSMAAGSHAAGKVVSVKYSASNTSGTLWMCTTTLTADTVGTNPIAFTPTPSNWTAGDVRHGGYGATGIYQLPVIVSTSGDSTGQLTEKQLVTNKTPVSFASRIVAANAGPNLKEEIVPSYSGSSQSVDWVHHVSGGRASKTARFHYATSMTIGTALTSAVTIGQIDAFWNVVSGTVRLRVRSQTTGASAEYQYYLDGVFSASSRFNTVLFSSSTTWTSTGVQAAWGAGAGESTISVTPLYSAGQIGLTLTCGSATGTAGADVEWDCDLAMVNSATPI